MDIDLAEALDTVDKYLRSSGLSELMEIDPAFTEEFDFGWSISVVGSEYRRTGNFSDRVVGCGPFLVDKKTRKIFLCGSAYPVEHYIQLYRSGDLKPVA